MRKKFAIVLAILFCLSLSACADRETPITSSQPNTSQEQSNSAVSDTNRLEENITEKEPDSSETKTDTRERNLKLIIDGQEIPVTLYDTPTANALYDSLPLELTFEDFNGTEKISYLSEQLPTEGEPDGCDPSVGDLCYYAPWGNLSIFYQDYQYSNSLIKLGHIDSGMELIENQENFSATLEVE